MRSSRWIRPIGAAVAAVVGLLCWCVATLPALAAEPISIGVIAPESHIEGKAIINAAELAVDEINSSGGINGRQIELHQYNTHLSASDAARAMQRAVQQDHVVALTGVFTSEVALALIPWASRLQVPFLITGAASTKIPTEVRENPDRYKYVFHSYVNSEILAKQACLVGNDLLIKNKKFSGFNRAVIFAEDAAWTKPVVATYKKCLPKAGFKVVDTIVFAPDTSDFTPIYSRIKDSKANVIMAAVAHVGIKSVVQWRHQHVPALFAGINGYATSSKFWKATNGAAQDVIANTPSVSTVALTDKTSGFIKAYKKKFGVSEPAYDAYTTYDAMYSIANAIKAAGGTSSDAMVKALEKTDFTGVLGKVAFHGVKDKYAHEVVFSPDPKKGQAFLTIQWEKGDQVVVWPDDLATAEIQIPSFVPVPEPASD